MALPVSAATDTYECDVAVGIGVITVNPNFAADLGLPGIGGCFVGQMENSGAAVVDSPPDCSVEYDADGDNFSDGPVEDSVTAGWYVWSFCDAGVVNAHIGLTVTY